MDRQELVSALSDALGRRQLVWMGTRGDDVESVAQLPQFDAAFSIIAAYGRRSAVESLALEQLSGVRVDLDAYDIDAEPDHDALLEFRRTLLGVLARPSAVFTYRPSTFLSAVCFARRDRCQYLGLFKDHQAAFEHKPWVESSIAELGLPCIPWKYVADEDQRDSLRLLREGPVMLRRSRTSGGTGLVRVEDEATLVASWPHELEAYVSVAPYIEGGVPLNVGAVVWNDGVTVHPASVQLIGIPGCTTRPFGYCGNDFGVVRDLDEQILGEVQRSVVKIGAWLGRHGYRGAFGADFLIADGTPLFTEVNPRFQGSTHASCALSVAADESCLILEHLAALLGMNAPATATVSDLARRHDDLSHVVVHWTGADAASVDPYELLQRLSAADLRFRADVLTAPELRTDRGATVARLTTTSRLTTNGFDLSPSWSEPISTWVAVASHGGGSEIPARA